VIKVTLRYSIKNRQLPKSVINRDLNDIFGSTNERFGVRLPDPEDVRSYSGNRTKVILGRRSLQNSAVPLEERFANALEFML
jgi:hypothetical protein